MTRYFFHLREGDTITKDVKGVTLPHLEGAIDTAKVLAQRFVEESALAGRSIRWGTEYEVEDEEGRLALVLPLSHFAEIGQIKRPFPIPANTQLATAFVPAR